MAVCSQSSFGSQPPPTVLSSRQTCECQRADSKGQEFLLLGCQEAQVARVPDIVLASHGRHRRASVPHPPTVLSEVTTQTTTVAPPNTHAHTTKHLHPAGCEGFPRCSGDGLAQRQRLESDTFTLEGCGGAVLSFSREVCWGENTCRTFPGEGFEFTSSEKGVVQEQRRNSAVTVGPHCGHYMSFPPWEDVTGHSVALIKKHTHGSDTYNNIIVSGVTTDSN